MRENRKRVTVFDFEPLTIIGKGAFGEVRVVRHKATGEILAMKKMNKNEMIYKNQVQHVRAEKDILSIAENPWIVDLKYSF
jgi:serine/threonine kinase 38